MNEGRKEKITLTKEEFKMYNELIEEAKETQSLIKIMYIRYKLKKIMKEARKRNHNENFKNKY